eukprot:2330970-Rhodomonas_salina.3
MSGADVRCLTTLFLSPSLFPVVLVFLSLSDATDTRADGAASIRAGRRDGGARSHHAESRGRRKGGRYAPAAGSRRGVGGGERSHDVARRLVRESLWGAGCGADVGCVGSAATRSLLKLLLPAVHKSPPAGMARCCRCAMPCHAMPCHAMPCHAMRCDAMRGIDAGNAVLRAEAGRSQAGMVSQRLRLRPETEQHNCNLRSDCSRMSFLAFSVSRGICHVEKSQQQVLRLVFAGARESPSSLLVQIGGGGRWEGGGRERVGVQEAESSAHSLPGIQRALAL